MNKKLTVLLSVLLILAFVFSISAFATSEDASTEESSTGMASYAGKKVSILGDSISTYNGVSNNTATNSTIGDNTCHYPSGGVTQNDTWWQQAIDILGMELLVNNSWSGSCIRSENGKGENAPAYRTRCVNLHSDTSEAPVLPDVIWVFMGTNDFTHFQSTLGTYAAINYETLITEGEDGTFTYATPATACEAYVIMLHKMQQAYPDAEIFCMNLLPRRVPMTKNDRGPVTEFNVELGKVVAKAGAHLVDLENCGIPVEPVYYDTYMHDSYVHPNDAGMDLMTAALLGEMVGTHSIVFNGIGTSNSNDAYYVEDGSAYTTTVSLNSSYVDLSVKVTMGGEDITSSVYSGGTVTIPAVTGDVLITATATLEYLDHLQSLPENLCKDLNLWTALTPEKSYFAGNAWNTKYYSVTFPISAGDQLWATSFAGKNSNGNSSTNGIRVTYFLEDGTFSSIDPGTIYSEFNSNGYITTPDGAVAVNVPMWTNSTSNQLFVLNKNHNFEIISSENGITIEKCSVCGLEQSNFDGAVAMDGFSIRLTGYNGLRGIFSFDHNKDAGLAEMNYELLEYGAIVVPEADYIADGSVVTIDTVTRALTTSGVKKAVWADGNYVGKILGIKDGIEQFALSVVNYENNHATNVYYCAYSIYKDPSEEIIVTINGYKNEDYKFINLYQTTLDMYINGAINASNTEDVAVWNTLLTGVVTLTEDEYSTSYTDMDGNSFTGDFIFKEVAQVYRPSNGEATVNSNVNITLLNNYSDNSYVAIYRGTGAIVGSDHSYSCQLSSTPNLGGKMTHPLLQTAQVQKISTIILDHGITSTGTYSFKAAYFKNFVYPSTLTAIGNSTFYQNYNATSIYRANASGVMQENEVGLADLSYITSLHTNNLFYKYGNTTKFTKIHLPATASNSQLGNAFVSAGENTTTRNDVVKVWCGNTAEPEAGVIDLSGATNIKSITGSSFSSLSSSQASYIMIIPDNLTSISNNSFGRVNLTEIRQASYNMDIAADIAANSYIADTVKYCDLEGNEWVTPTEEITLKILAIGNSFSVDAMQWLWNIADDAKKNGDASYQYVSLGNLYIGGCSLDTHWSNIQNDSGSYTYYTNSSGSWSAAGSYKLSAALTSQKWDIITIQQVSSNSGMPDTYTNLTNIVDYVNTNKTNENARIYWHMTWAYQQDSSHSGFSNYDKNQSTMYTAITDTVKKTVLANTSITGVIPSGTAIQNTRSSYIGDTLTRDGYHLSYGLGRYIAGMTWFAYLTGESIDNITWVPDEYKEVSLYLDIIKESVENALTAPYEVTSSAYTDEPEYTDEQLFILYGLDFTNYTALDITEYTHFQEYYQSEKELPSVMLSGSNTAKKFIGIGTFDKTTLPIGSVIILDGGYQYRPEGWVDESTTNSSRPDNVTSQFVITDEAWWGDFTIRGFNLAHSGANTTVSASDAEHFRIYIPQ